MGIVVARSDHFCLDFYFLVDDLALDKNPATERGVKVSWSKKAGERSQVTRCPWKVGDVVSRQ